MLETHLQVEIDFDEKTVRKQQIRHFNRMWIKKIPNYLKFIFFILIFIYFIDSFRGRFNNIQEFWIFSKFYVLVNSAFIIVLYIYQRIEFQNLLNSFIKKTIEQNETSTTIELADEYLRLCTINYDIKYNWNLIQYEIVKNTLYIHIQMPTPFQFIIDRIETGEYDTIIEIVKVKSKVYKPN